MTATEHEARHLLQVYGQLPIEPDSASGVHLHCGDRRILDLYGGHAVAALGYGHPDLLDALKTQAEKLFFQSNAIALEVRARAADALVEFAPAGLERVFFVNSGAEANENALRLACRLTGRRRIAAIEHGFHGRTAAAGAVTWGSADRWYGFPERPFDVDFIARNDVQSAAKTIGSDTAAVIVELVQGVAGAFDLDPAFVRSIIQACARHDALLIVDEVQTGIGRCGESFASKLYGVAPDILTCAKSLGAGFPCGAVLMTQAVAQSAGPGDLGTTFGGGPLACAVIDRVISVIQRDNLIGNVRTLHDRLASALPVGPVDSVQGKGFMIGLKCYQPAAVIQKALLEHDILVGSSADPNVIRLLPPLTLESSHIDQFISALAQLPAS